MLGEPYVNGTCTVASCGAPATHTDPAWAASGHDPYRCAAHAEAGVHVLAAPRHDDAGWPFDYLTAFLMPASGLTVENAYSAALQRDALPTPAESRVRARERYAHHTHGTTWEALTGAPVSS